MTPEEKKRLDSSEKYYAYIAAASEEVLRENLEEAIRQVMRSRPFALQVFKTNRKGERIGIVVCHAPVQINERLVFDPRKQFSPQILSEPRKFRDDWDARSKLIARFEIWLSAACRLQWPSAPDPFIESTNRF